MRTGEAGAGIGPYLAGWSSGCPRQTSGRTSRWAAKYGRAARAIGPAGPLGCGGPASDGWRSPMEHATITRRQVLKAGAAALGMAALEGAPGRARAAEGGPRPAAAAGAFVLGGDL